MAMYSAGEVSVDVFPDTSGFWAILNAELHSRHPEVHVDVDTRDVGKAQAQLNHLDGQTLTSTIKIDGDYSGLDQMSRRLDAMQKQASKQLRQTATLDPKPFLSDLDKITGQYATANKRMRDQWAKTHDTLTQPLAVKVPTSQAEANIEALTYKFAALDEKTISTRASVEELNDKLAGMSAAQRAEQQQIDQSMLRNRRQLGAYTAQLSRAQKKLEELKKTRDDAKASKDNDLLKSVRKSIDGTIEKIKGYKAGIRDVGKAHRSLQNESERSAKTYEKSLKPVLDGIEKGKKSLRELAATNMQLDRAMQDVIKTQHVMSDGFGGRATRYLDDLNAKGRQATETLKTMGEQAAKTATLDLIGKELDKHPFKTAEGDLNDYNKENAKYVEGQLLAGDALLDHLRKSDKLTDSLDKQNAQIDSLIDSYRKAKPLGVGLDETFGDMGKRLNDTKRKLNDLRVYAISHPVKARAEMDASDWDREIAKLFRDAHELAAVLSEEHEIQVRVDGWKKDAERLEKRLDRLKHQRLDVPVDFEMDEKRIINRMREVAAAIKANPERAVELEADLELDMKHAEEKLKRFKDKNDELKMDLDLETALARAHLAYFTRPRTVDIFAKFKGTDLGKIFTGMTSGATGLKGVENQFQRLVNLMDSLDTKVPKFAIMGSMFMAVGAGATNLAGSIGGVGKSLVSLSKAAYAAPAALGTVAAGFYGIYAAVKVADDRFKLANTALKDMQTTVGNAFWDEASDAITRMSNTLGGDFVRNLSEVSAEEGRMAAGMADIITRANEAGRVNAMLDHAASAVRNLTPGVDAVVDSFTSLGRVGGQYVPQLTNWISQNLTHFAMWASEVESDNTRVEAAMRGVREQAGYLGSSVGSLKGVFTGVFGTLAQHENGLQGFSEAVEAANRAVNGIRFQDTLAAWIDGAQRAQNIVRNSFSSIGQDAYSLRDEVYNAFADAGQVVGSTLENVSQLLASSGSGIRDFTDGIASGWSRAMDAIGDSGPVFSDMLTMVGSLANTFGGTFAASLKAASPMLRVIASATSAISDAFNSLPEPVKAAAGLWVTFGRAGKTAIKSLKSGMLQNIQQTLKYKATMQQLGVTTKQTSASIRELVAAMDSLRRGQVSDALSGGIAGVRQLGTDAEEATAKVRGVATAGRAVESSTTVIASGSRKAASGLSEAGEAASKSAGRLSAVGGAIKSAGSFAKSAGGLILDAFGGPTGLAVTAGMALVTTAISDYSLKAQSAETASQNVAAAMKNIATSTQDTARSLSAVGKAIKTNLEDVNFGEDGLQGWLLSHTGGALYGQFGDAASAASKLGISLDHVAQSVAGGKTQYQALNKELQAQRKNAAKNADETGRSVKIDKEKLDAVNKLQDTAKKANDQAMEQAKTTAKNNGYTEAYVQKLYDMGAGYDQIAAKTQSATQKAKNYSNSLKLAAQNQQDHSNAIIAARSAGSLYEKTLAGMGDTIQQVNALASQGQQVWNAQANDFDLTTEAGRLASDSLGTLASNAKSYVNAMVDSGDSLDEVNAKNDKMRQSFYDTALQMTGNADAAKALTDQYMMTPSEVETTFKAHVETAKTDMLQYLSLIRDTFPDGSKGDAIYTAIVNAITTGAVTDITGVQQLVHQYTTGEYQAVVTADGRPALLQMSTINQLGIKLDGKNYTTTLSADDLASPKINEVVSALSASGLDGKTIQMILAAKGDAKLTIEQTQEALTKLGASAQDVDIVINAQDHSKAEVDAAIANISKLTGMSEDEIRFMLDATDNASGKMDKVQDEKKTTEKPSSFDITANDDDAQVKLAAYKQSDGQTIATNDVMVSATDNASPTTEHVRQSVESIPPFWQSVFGSVDGTSGIAGLVSQAVRDIPQSWQSVFGGVDGTSGAANVASGAVRGIPPFWQSMFAGGGNTMSVAYSSTQAVRQVPQDWRSKFIGGGNTISMANQSTQAVRQVPSSWQSQITANVSGLGAVQSLSSAIRGLASKNIDIVTNFIQHGSPSHNATGGRIVGPGTGTSDSIPAMLSNGEMVIRAASVRKLDARYGRSFLNALNAYGDADKAMQPSAFAVNARRMNQAYATGGRVTAGDMPWNIELNPVINVKTDSTLNSGVRELNDRVGQLTGHVDSLAAGLPVVIARNSSPWPSQRAFNRDVRGAL